ncbi:hypothetical protein L210DRAFT_3526156 [Boletus edulis BED1]|uniref:Uncharacterized protein n=1 Tax=Boletus edulis BED1 TaxID=1328754 RepID=A0AAD4GK58_BOLED|nr:hypothetical protein L210DRAFT_3585418 [Boletus edulis BED1]KAF8447388.1 hypothetical protein L210DRAFT_3526156 [Boletus edulis BED1]
MRRRTTTSSQRRIHQLTTTYIPCPLTPRSNWSMTKPRPEGPHHVHHGHLVDSPSHKTEHITPSSA